MLERRPCGLPLDTVEAQALWAAFAGSGVPRVASAQTGVAHWGALGAVEA